jgi:hypothetical protein
MTASKKRCATLFKFMSFFISLSLLPQGPGKGDISKKDPSQRRKRAPSPPTHQGFEGYALRGSATAPEHAESGMTLGTSVTWPRLGLRSRGTLGHFRDQRKRFCNGIPLEGGIEPSDPIEWARSGKSPAGTFGARLWATSRPLSNGARASTRITR